MKNEMANIIYRNYIYKYIILFIKLLKSVSINCAALNRIRMA